MFLRIPVNHHSVNDQHITSGRSMFVICCHFWTHVDNVLRTEVGSGIEYALTCSDMHWRRFSAHVARASMSCTAYVAPSRSSSTGNGRQLYRVILRHVQGHGIEALCMLFRQFALDIGIMPHLHAFCMPSCPHVSLPTTRCSCQCFLHAVLSTPLITDYKVFMSMRSWGSRVTFVNGVCCLTVSFN
jgi:hypothetical protein